MSRLAIAALIAAACSTASATEADSLAEQAIDARYVAEKLDYEKSQAERTIKSSENRIKSYEKSVPKLREAVEKFKLELDSAQALYAAKEAELKAAQDELESVRTAAERAAKQAANDMAAARKQIETAQAEARAAAKAKAWDALDVRFPTPYQDTFKHYATVQRVPSTELMAIARRESAFFPEAHSPVGARGLMQIMPATGKQVASELGRPHTRAELYEVEHNILLGSAYYRQLLDRFDGNRIFALAAYNAGPHRVDRWRNAKGDQVPVDIWVETIPYRETRNYVQAVLSYNVVFQYRLGDTHSLLTEAERKALY